MFTEHGVVVVQAMDGIWMDAEEAAFTKGQGCLSFEVKGCNDATIVFSSEPCLSRLDISKRETDCGGEAAGCNELYTVIFGSHRNSKLKICRGAASVALRDDLPGALLHSTSFKPFWVNLSHDTLTVGSGPVGCHILSQHRSPLPTCRLYVGLFSWDRHVAFRNVRAGPALPQPPMPTTLPRAGSLSWHAHRALEASICDATICHIIVTLHATWSTTTPIWATAVTVLARRFIYIFAATPEAFMDLPSVAVLQALACGDLAAPEIGIFSAIEAWAYGVRGAHTPPAAPRHGVATLLQALQHVRFPLMAPAELARVQASRLARDVPGLIELAAESTVLEAAAAAVIATPPHLLPVATRPTGQPHDAIAPLAPCQPPGHRTPSQVSRCSSAAAHSLTQARSPRLCRQSELWRAWRAQRRCPPDAQELCYMQDGDRNGVLHYLGTNCGSRKQFVNPQRCGVVAVASSSPYNPDSDAVHLTSREFHSSTRAYANAEGETYWAVDFGRGHGLACNHYTMRMNNGCDFPRSWKLQGSDDGAGGWATIQDVRDDHSFQRAGQLASWRVPHAECRFYRCIRVLLSGPTWGGSCDLNINQFEFYGYYLA